MMIPQTILDKGQNNVVKSAGVKMWNLAAKIFSSSSPLHCENLLTGQHFPDDHHLAVEKCRGVKYVHFKVVW